MSPIENVVPNLVDNSTNQNVELRNKQDRSRDLFGVQLEVTSLLLEAERRKLSVLQKELQVALEEGGSIKAKEHQKQELLVAITRIQAQHDHLDKEYREHALGALLSANTRGSGKSNRSQPAIGLKHTPKSRESLVA
jgi:TorA maturation chaperone TorD